MTKYSAKLYIYIGVWARDLYIDEAHMALDIFCFVVFFSYILHLYDDILIALVDISSFESRLTVALSWKLSGKL